MGDALTTQHLQFCDGADHEEPIGYEPDEKWSGEHGRPLRRWSDPTGYPDQCMCGHPNYTTCPDWQRFESGPVSSQEEKKEGETDSGS